MSKDENVKTIKMDGEALSIGNVSGSVSSDTTQLDNKMPYTDNWKTHYPDEKKDEHDRG